MEILLQRDISVNSLTDQQSQLDGLTDLLSCAWLNHLTPTQRGSKLSNKSE